MNSIDIEFNFYSDSRGGDPDLRSPTLRKFHQILWSRELPCGLTPEIIDKKSSGYLEYVIQTGNIEVSSDSLVHSYKFQKSKKWLINQINQNEVDELRNIGSTIGGYIIFPKLKIENRFTINQARGVNRYIDDRFDLTLECIRLYYLGKDSPLYTVLCRYKYFFDLFLNFNEYVNYFLLNDLVDEQSGQIKFYLPFSGFKTKPNFSSVDDYINYKFNVIKFVNSRNKRIGDLFA